MFEAKLTSPAVLKNVFDAISVIADEVILDCTDSGIFGIAPVAICWAYVFGKVVYGDHCCAVSGDDFSSDAISSMSSIHP